MNTLGSGGRSMSSPTASTWVARVACALVLISFARTSTANPSGQDQVDQLLYEIVLAAEEARCIPKNTSDAEILLTRKRGSSSTKPAELHGVVVEYRDGTLAVQLSMRVGGSCISKEQVFRAEEKLTRLEPCGDLESP